jgi:hypothetical protein
MTQTGQLNYSAGARPQGVGTGCNLSPDDIDVTAQIVHVIREGQRKPEMAHGVLNAVEFGLFLGQIFVVQIGVERSL